VCRFRNAIFPIGIAFAFFTNAAWSLPRQGQRAPAIRVSKVLSATQQSLEPSALVGKTVILDFWATWCGPCVAAMPHVNELEAALDPKKFVFIALDDEDETIVKAFLAKRKVSSIVALDKKGATFAAYGISSRPTTIVIGPQGNIALVSKPLDLTSKMLLDISNSRNAEASPALAPSQSNVSTSARLTKQGPSMSLPEPHANVPADLGTILAGVSLRTKRPNEPDYSIYHDGANQTLVGFGSKDLISMALETSDRHVQYVDEMPAGKFDYATSLGELDENVESGLFVAAVKEAFRIDVTRKEMPQEALILKRAEDVPLHAQPTFNAHTSSGAERRGSTITFSNYSMAALAMHLEKKYGTPVVDETGLSGGFDGSLTLPANQDDLSGSLRRDLGLYVERGTRSIPTFVVSHRKEGKK